MHLNFQKTLQNVYLMILAFPGIKLVTIAQTLDVGPETVVEHIRKLVQDDCVKRVRIRNANIWFETAEAVEFEAQYKLQSMARLRDKKASDEWQANKTAINRARLKAIADKAIDAFEDSPVVHRIVCAKTVPRINTTAANSVWQLADRVNA